MKSEKKRSALIAIIAGLLLTAEIVVLLFALQVPAFSGQQANKGSDNAGSIIHNGLMRTYRIHIPSLYDKSKPLPLVIALHGGGGTGEKMERHTLGGFNSLSDKEGFVVVYPDGIDKRWNDGRGAEETGWRTHKENIDDVGFISALIDHLIKTMGIDTKRVYITGISNGGQMSYRLACELSEKVTAIAPVVAQMPEKLHPKCKPARAVPVLIISGKDDPLVPWEGGEVKFGRKKFGRVLSLAGTVKFWVNNNRCSPSPVITQEPDKDPQDGTRVRKEAYNGCKDGTEVVLYTIEGGGHTWPGGYQYLPERTIGKTSMDIDANEVIWDFFQRHAIRNNYWKTQK